jgi:hypothetical protein
MAGRGFRQMMITILKPTAQVNKAMTDLLGPSMAVGQTWQDLVNPGGKFIGLAGYFDLLAASVEHLTSAQRNEKTALLATANALPGLVTLINDQVEARKQGVNIFSVYTKLLQNQVDEEVLAYKRIYEEQTGLPFSLEGALARMGGMWDTYRNSASGQMDALRQAWNVAILDMAKPVAEVFIPLLTDAMSTLTDLTRQLKNGTGWVTFGQYVIGATLLIGTLLSTFGKVLQLSATITTLAGGAGAITKAGGVGAALQASAAGGSVGAGIALAAPWVAAIVAAAVAATMLILKTKREQAGIAESRAEAPIAVRAKFDELFVQELDKEAASEWIGFPKPQRREDSWCRLLARQKSFAVRHNR